MSGSAFLLVMMLSAAAPHGLPPTGVWPVDPPVVVSEFRPARPDWTAGHRGVDLSARTGTPVRSLAGGRVAYVGTVAGKPVVTVALAGPGALRATYEPVVARLATGARVNAGEVIGIVAARGGHCGGDAGCVHVGLRSADGYLDPLRLITRRPAVLKPLRSLGAGPRVSQGEGGAEPLHRDVGVSLSGRQAGVAEQFLNGPQIGSALQNVRSCRVPQSVGSQVRDSGLHGQSVHHSTHGPRVDSGTAKAEEQRRAGRGPRELRTGLQPLVQRPGGRVAEGNDPLLVALPAHPGGAALAIDGVKIHGAQFRHPNTRGVQELDHGPVPPGTWGAIVRRHLGEIHEHTRLVGAEHRRQGPGHLGAGQSVARVVWCEAAPRAPRGERPG